MEEINIQEPLYSNPHIYNNQSLIISRRPVGYLLTKYNTPIQIGDFRGPKNVFIFLYINSWNVSLLSASHKNSRGGARGQRFIRVVSWF